MFSCWAQVILHITDGQQSPSGTNKMSQGEDARVVLAQSIWPPTKFRASSCLRNEWLLLPFQSSGGTQSRAIPSSLDPLHTTRQEPQSYERAFLTPSSRGDRACPGVCSPSLWQRKQTPPVQPQTRFWDPRLVDREGGARLQPPLFPCRTQGPGEVRAFCSPLWAAPFLLVP